MANTYYSPKALVDWFHRTLGINAQPGDEIHTTCPKCGQDKFYFNIKKRVGTCQRASCEWHKAVFVNDIAKIVGFGPNQDGQWIISEEQPKAEVILPGHPILIWAQNRMMTSNEEALSYLRSRGLDDNLILNWGLTCDGERVYVPIYSDGILVNFNSRVLPGYSYPDGKKYLYCKGAETGSYILGWNECRDWTELVLVENTFVSLAYRARLHCSTTFGSNVSERQADLIARSGIRKVALLWDENAELSVNRAWTRLEQRGVKVAAWKILGQPDNYPIEWVVAKCKEVLAAADAKQKWVDIREECAKLREMRNDETSVQSLV